MKALKILPLAGAMMMTPVFAFAQTWTQTTAPVKNWTAVAISADGSHLVVTANNDSICNSTNGGTT